MTINRRDFLLAAVAGPVLAARQPRVVLDRGFGRTERLVDGIAVTLADPTRGAACLSNGGVISGRDASLLIEGHFQPDGAALEVDAARLISRRPIRAAVDTHFHFDHTFGNAGYATRGIPIIAHEAVPALMKRDYAGSKAADDPSAPATLQERLRQATTDEERTRLRGELEAARLTHEAIEHAVLAYPTELIADRSTPTRIDLGGVSVDLETHHGHTPGDLTIAIRDRDVMFVGDLLFYREYPVALDADMAAWRRVLDAFSRLPRSMRIVPGHGPVCHRETVVAQIDLFDDLRAHAERMRSRGAGAEEASSTYVVPQAFRDYEIFAWSWTIGAAIRSFYGA